MPFVSITRLRVRSFRHLPAFIVYSILSSRQANAVPGNISAVTFKDAGLVFWTRSVWRDEASMRAFMTSGAHLRVMPHLLDWCDEAALVHWVQDSEEPPPWPEAHRRMLAEGRRSKVRHPSEAHRRFEIPAPRG
jgi:hypothetical protein